jgi:hypothetical protein
MKIFKKTSPNFISLALLFCPVILQAPLMGQGASGADEVCPVLPDERLAWAQDEFEENCGICHEDNGNAEKERLNLIDDVWMHGGSLTDIERTIREGVPGTKMKSMENKYTAGEIQDLAKYVKILHSRQMAPEPEIQISRTGPELPPVTELLELKIVPEGVVLEGPGSKQRFIVLGSYRDRVERDVTSACRIYTDDAGLLSVEETGIADAEASGDTILHAELGSIHAQTRIRVEDSAIARPFSFEREIGDILTRRGCNAATCHGGVKGRGGFKLSLNMLYPDEDYEWIVQGGVYKVLTDVVEGDRIPRFNLSEPEKSLILLKPTLELEHEGGKRFSKDSEDYRTILEWIRAGGKYEDPGADGLKIESLEVYPAEAVLGVGTQHQVVVMARLANGRHEDVTGQVRFGSNNREIVKVSPEGLVEAVGPGEIDVVISAAGTSARARIGVIENTIEEFPDIPRQNFIDEKIFAKLEKFHILPSPLSSDKVFMRRVCLDLTGTLPPVVRLKEFLDDPDPDKRRKLIDILMETPEFEDYWTLRLAEYLRVGNGSSLGANQPGTYAAWLSQGVRENRPYDQLARERIAAQGQGGPASFYSFDMRIPLMVAEDMRIFLGRRLDCAECHNHPSETWSQNQFWGLGAFYGRMTHMDFSILFDDPDGKEYDYGEEGKEQLEFKKVVQPRSRQEIRPTFLDGTTLAENRMDDPRQAFAEWITAHPYFAEAAVNRIWGFFFHRGIVDPVDEFDSTNMASHPELLRVMAEDFRRNGHDLRRLIRQIVNSRTYQLSGELNASNQHDEMNFSHVRARPMVPEVLLDAITSVTGIPVEFDKSQGVTVGAAPGRAPVGTRAVQLIDSYNWPVQFLQSHGRISRGTVADRNYSPNLTKALHLVVGDTYTDNLGAEGGRINRLMNQGTSNREIVDEFYLVALGRHPTEREVGPILEFIHSKSSMLDNPFFEQNESRKKVLEDLMWALLCSKEFMYNH